MPTSTHGKNNRSRGFTLIELAVVLFILSLILLTALPKVSLLSQGGAEGFMRKAALRIEKTLEDAIFESRGGQLSVDISEGIIEGYRYNEGELLMSWALKLPDGLRITMVRTNFGKDYLSEEVIIPFSSMGYIPKTSFTVVEEEGEDPHTITINPFTGKVAIINGIIPESM